MTIKCDSRGWFVEAVWYGSTRCVYRPENGPGLEVLDIQDCVALVRGMEET